MTFSSERGELLSPALYAEAFSVPTEEAARDLATLLAAGALPLTLSEGDEVLSQGFALPMLSEGCPLLYLYALLTAPKARGRGCLRTLIKGAEELGRALGASGLCLLPATEALADAYRRMGFYLAYPIGAPAAVTVADELALRTEHAPRVSEPMTAEAFRAAMPRALPPALFDFALSTVSALVQPMMLDGVPALACPDDPTCLLAMGEGGALRRVSDPVLLLKPLGGRLPCLIPEPIPR